MIFQNLLYCTPFIESCLPNYSLALHAKIVNLGLIRTANCAKVLKVNVHDELLRYDLIFVFSDVFWAELHFARLDVIASLDKSGVEHYSEHDFVGPAPLRHEHYLNITLQDALFLLLICHQEDHPVFS